LHEAEGLEEIWTSVYIGHLQAHTSDTTMKQIDALASKGCMCSFLEQQLHDLCLMCALTRRAHAFKGLFRHDFVDGSRGLVYECLIPKHVVRVNLIDRVIYVLERAIVLCKKCFYVKSWNCCDAINAKKVGGCCV
jgi:hypothetical protein